MKILLLCLLLEMLVAEGFSQAAKNDSPMTSEEHLAKSKRKEVASRIFLVPAIAGVTSGILTLKCKNNCAFEQSATGYTLLSFGVVMGVISFTLYLDSIREKKRAQAVGVSMKLEAISPVVGKSLGQTSVPALGVTYMF